MKAALPLQIEADLQLSLDGRPAVVRSEGDVLAVVVPDARAAWHALRTLSRPRGGISPLRQAVALATDTGLAVCLRVGRRTVARLGPAVEPSVLARLLRLGRVRLSLRQAALAWVRP